MATVNRFHETLHELGVHDEEHPIWTRSFSDQVRLRQVKDDLLAGKSVSAVLVTIVTMGLLLGIIGVLLAI